jgi:hypothetical protein
VDFWSFHVWFASVPYQIPADPKYCPDIGSLLWTYFATSRYAMLLLVQNFGLGHRGAALATSISYWFNVALLAVYVKVSEYGRRSWHGWSREALKLKDAKVYLKLAIPSTFMTW